MNNNYDRSVQLIKTIPSLSAHIKLVTNGDFIKIDHLIDDKSNPINIDPKSTFGNSIKRFISSRFGSNGSSLDNIYKEEFLNSIDSDFSTQYQNTYEMGVTKNVNSLYPNEFKCFAPLYFDERNTPTHFVVFKRFANATQDLENREADLFGTGTTAVKVFDLRQGDFGEFIQSHFEYLTDNQDTLDTFINFNGSSTVSGYDLRSGLLTTKVEDLEYENERKIYDFDKYITEIYRRNDLIHPRLLNLEFHFDDLSNDNNFFHYFGLYLYQGDTIPADYDGQNLDPIVQTQLNDEISNNRIVLFTDSDNKPYKVDNFLLPNELNLSPQSIQPNLEGKFKLTSITNFPVSAGSSSFVEFRLARQPFLGEFLSIDIGGGDIFTIEAATENLTSDPRYFILGETLEETKENLIQGFNNLLDLSPEIDYACSSYKNGFLVYSLSSSFFWEGYTLNHSPFLEIIPPYYVNDSNFTAIDKTYGYSPDNRTLSIARKVRENLIKEYVTNTTQEYFINPDGDTPIRIKAILPYVINGIIKEDEDIIILESKYNQIEIKSFSNVSINVLENIYLMNFCPLVDLSTNTYDKRYSSLNYEFDQVTYEEYLLDKLQNEQSTATPERIAEINNEIALVEATFNSFDVPSNFGYEDVELTNEYDFFKENFEVSTQIERINNNVVRWGYKCLNDVRNNEMRVNISRIFRNNFAPYQIETDRDLKYYPFDWFLIGDDIPPQYTQPNNADLRGYVNFTETDASNTNMDAYEANLRTNIHRNYSFIKRIAGRAVVGFRGQLIDLGDLKYIGWRFSVIFKNQPTSDSVEFKLIENETFQTLTVFIYKDLNDDIFLKDENGQRFTDRAYFYFSERVYTFGGTIQKNLIPAEVKLFYEQVQSNVYELSDNWIREELGTGDPIYTVSTPNSGDDLRNFYIVSPDQTAQIVFNGGQDVLYCTDFVSVDFNSFECKNIYYVQDYLNVSQLEWDNELNPNVEKFQPSYLKEEYIESGLFFKINQKLIDSNILASFVDQTFSENFFNEVSLSRLRERLESEFNFTFITPTQIEINNLIETSEVIETQTTLYGNTLIGYENEPNTDSGETYKINRFNYKISPLMDNILLSDSLNFAYYKGLNDLNDYHVFKKGNVDVIQDQDTELVLINNSKFHKIPKHNLLNNVFSTKRYRDFRFIDEFNFLTRQSYPNFEKSFLGTVYPNLPNGDISLNYDLSDYLDDTTIDLLPKFVGYLSNLYGDFLNEGWFRLVAEKFYKVRDIGLGDSNKTFVSDYVVKVERLDSFTVTFTQKHKI